MKKEINTEEIRNFNSLSGIYAALLIACIILPVPLVKFLGWVGFAVYFVLCGITLYFAVKIEKIKKQHNIQTYKEIVAFTNGETLDEITSAREEGKRPYQKIMLAVCSGAAALIVFGIFFLLFR